MQLSIIKNAKKNILFGIINKLIILLCPFITRMFIKRMLGIQYLGLSGLFSSILDVLSLSELGFGSAMLFFMYKPVSNGDTKEVNALLNLYKRVYIFVGLVILALGFSILPFIDIFVSDSPPNDININYLYIVYVINSSVSYFFYAYMSSIIIVNQRDDINSIINSITKIILTVIQLILLYITKNYYYFVIVMPVFTVINNIWIMVIVKKQYPMYHAEGTVPTTLISKIKKNVMGAFVQKSCSATRTSIDSICVSTFMGVRLTGIYNNYLFITNGIFSIMSMFCNSFLGGIGNHVATKSVDENFEELKKLDFLYINIAGWATAFLLCCYQPFMKIWMGSDALLSLTTVIFICIYFYVSNIGMVRYMYMTTNGLFWEHRWRSAVETIVNVSLNILLGKTIGINGIVIATIISLLTCNFIWANIITFGKYFGKGYLKKYYIYQLKYFVLNTLICCASYFACGLIRNDNDFLVLLLRIIICLILPSIFYLIAYRDKINEIIKMLK